MLNSLLGKYRTLAVAIGLFLVLDLGVLLFSFYVSSQIRGDAARINTASELRTLAQQATKALLTLREEQRSGLPIQTSMAELTESIPVFNQNLVQLSADFAVAEQDPLHRILLGEHLQENAEQLNTVKKTWAPINEAASVVTKHSIPEQSEIEFAATKAVAVNIKLMEQASDLTAMLEAAAGQRASLLRYVQMLGIVLALCNFVFIIFKFLRSLNAVDRRLKAAHTETDNILSTVREGLFLVRTDGRISAQHSRSLPGVLGVTIEPGGSVNDLLRKILSSEDFEVAREYLELLLSGQVKPGLVKQLNPLVEVALVASDTAARRHVTFDFTLVRSLEAEDQQTLLVTVFDVSEQKALQAEISATRKRIEVESAILSQVLQAEPEWVEDFLRTAAADLQTINEQLKEAAGDRDYQRLLESVFRTIHGIKGQAAMVGLPSIEVDVHRIEDMLATLRYRKLTGKDLIPVSIGISELLMQFGRIRGVTEKLARFAGQRTTHTAPPPATATEAIEAPGTLRLADLAQRGAADLNKEVIVDATLLPGSFWQSPLAPLAREILPQLIRNAIVHGIEAPDERQRKGKPAAGKLTLSLSQPSSDDLLLSVHDDGRGLSSASIRQTLAANGAYSSAALESMNERALIAALFEPGVSTADGVSSHAGRGVGLDLVKQRVSKLGGRLRVRSTPDRFTEFQMVFPRTAS